MVSNKVYIYGKHAVLEAVLNSPKAIDEIFISPQFDDVAIRETLRKSGIRNSVLMTNKMPREVDPTAVHQGLFALMSLDRLVVPFEEFVEGLKITNEVSLVVLGELSDPQNVGAIIRSAAAFGISAVLIPEHNQAQVTGTVVKVSAGMAFRVPLVSVKNVNNAIRELKDRGFVAYGLAGEAKQILTKEAFELPTVFVLGNEAEGIREKTRELCDKLLRIPMSPNCESLNAATSASVTFYAWSAKHPEALRTVRSK